MFDRPGRRAPFTLYKVDSSFAINFAEHHWDTHATRGPGSTLGKVDNLQVINLPEQARDTRALAGPRSPR
jgi:hypothetical protein